MTPQAECSATETVAQEEESQMQRMMAKRSKIIKELMQTEKDYLNDLELCIREVVQPLRSKQVNATLRVPPPLHRILNGITSTMESNHQSGSICCRAGRVMGPFPGVPGVGRFQVSSDSHFLCQQRDT